MDIVNEIENYKAEIASANSLLEEANTKATELNAALADKDKEIAALSEKLVFGENKISEIIAKFDASEKEKAELVAKISELEAAAKTVEQATTEVAASQGIKPLKVDVAAEAVDKATVLKTYLELQAKDSMEAARYFTANKDLILG